MWLSPRGVQTLELLLDDIIWCSGEGTSHRISGFGILVNLGKFVGLKWDFKNGGKQLY